MVTSIIIPSLNRTDLLADCLTALSFTAPDVEVIIANYGGTFAQNCNKGADKATGDILIFLNDDTIPQPGWLKPLIAPIPERAGITGAQLFYPDGCIQHSGVYFDAPDNILTAHNMTWESKSGPRDAVTGACMAIHVGLFHALKGFDEGYVNGYEDIDLCLRAKKQGVVIRYVAESRIIHLESQSGPARWTHVSHNIARLQELWNVGTRGD